MADRPLVFIGSSKEQLHVAKAIQENLQEDCECQLWSQGTFDGSPHSYLEQLIGQLHRHQFGIIVLTPDDLVTSRGQEKPAPRDNLLFELGLLIGVLGRDRTAMIVDQTIEMKLPSDLSGIDRSTYSPPEQATWQSALGGACTRIQKRLASLQTAGWKSEQALPEALRTLGEYWRRYAENNPTKPHIERFKLYSFCGITDEQESDAGSRDSDAGSPDNDLEDIHFLWADAGCGSSIQARVLRDEGKRIQIRFDNKECGYPGNVAIRIHGRNLLYKKGGFTTLTFQARIPADALKPDLGQVQLGIRIVDALQTHWMYALREGYFPLYVEHSSADEWAPYAIDLSARGKSGWKVFEVDGNALYHGERPDFSTIQAVVVEVGRRNPLKPGPGCGVVEIKDMAVT